MKLFLKLEAPFEWVRIKGDRVEAFGEVANLDGYPINDEDDVIGVVPGEWVTSHQVTLPAKTRKQFTAALPYALEESISEDIENLHFVCANWKAGEPCTVQVVAKDKMQEWQALANHFRLPIQQLIPDHILLPFHDAANYSIARLSESDAPTGILAAHRDGASVTIDSDLLDVWLMDLPLDSVVAVNDQQLAEQLIKDYPERDFRHWPFGSKMAHWLEYPFLSKLDLWSDRFRPSVSRFNLRRLVLPLALIGIGIFFKFAFDTYKYFALHSELASLRQESRALLAEHVPEVGEVQRGKEREFMQRAIARMGSSQSEEGLHFVLAQIAPTLKQLNVTLSELSFRNSEIIITCVLSDLSQVDTITKQINAKPNLSARLQSSETDEGRIIASYKLVQAI